jgi:hypothetical protein
MQPEAAALAAAAAENARALRQVPRPGAAPRVVDAGAGAGANRPPLPRNPAPAAPAAEEPINPVPLAGGGRVAHAVDAGPGANPVIVPPPPVPMEDVPPALDEAAEAAAAAVAIPRAQQQVHEPLGPAPRVGNAGAAEGANPPVANGAQGGGNNMPHAPAQRQRQARPAAAAVAASPAEIEAATVQVRCI